MTSLDWEYFLYFAPDFVVDDAEFWLLRNGDEDFEIYKKLRDANMVPALVHISGENDSDAALDEYLKKERK